MFYEYLEEYSMSHEYLEECTNVPHCCEDGRTNYSLSAEILVVGAGRSGAAQQDIGILDTGNKL